MAVADRDELWEVKCQCIHCRDRPLCTISLSLAKPGEAMPGPYSSLMVFRRRASRSCAGRAVRGRKTQGNADAALIRLLTSNKDSGTRRSAVHATVRSGSVS